MKKILFLISLITVSFGVNANFWDDFKYFYVSDAARKIITPLNEIETKKEKVLNCQKTSYAAFFEACKNAKYLPNMNDDKAVKAAATGAIQRLQASTTFTRTQGATELFKNLISSPFLYIAVASGISWYAAQNGYVTQDMVKSVNLALPSATVLLGTTALASTAAIAQTSYNTRNTYQKFRDYSQQLESYANLQTKSIDTAIRQITINRGNF